MDRFALALACLLVMPGCARTQGGAPEEQPDLAAADSAEYVARGNEPFWSVSVTRDGVVFREPERPDGLYGPYAPPTRQGASLVFRTALGPGGSTALELTIEEEPCNDSMSGQAFRYAATARVGDRVLAGCAERASMDSGQDTPAIPGPGEAVAVRGAIAEGAECPVLVVEPERRFSLTGDLGRFKVGDRVCVHGNIAEMSICMAGQATIAITAIAPEDSCP